MALQQRMPGVRRRVIDDELRRMLPQPEDGKDMERRLQNRSKRQYGPWLSAVRPLLRGK